MTMRGGFGLAVGISGIWEVVSIELPPMNASLIDLAAWICLGLIAATVIHAAVVAAVLNLRGVEDFRPLEGKGDGTPPITWFRPIKAGVTGLREKLETFLASIREGDQVI